MKQNKLRILVALAGLAAIAAQAGGPPRNTAPIVQLPPSVQPEAIATPMAGPDVSLPPPRDDFYATQARARPSAPTVTTQAMAETPAPAYNRNHTYRGGEHGPTVDLPQK
jgi:hypothetical protein